MLDLTDRHLARYQQIVTRLAGNSVQVKTWCFTATAALGALAFDRDKPEIFGAALVLVAAFFYLDAYYLSLEQGFRRASDALAERVAGNEDVGLRELLIISRPNDDLTAGQILSCGAHAKTSAIYLVIVIALIAALLTGVN